jgi:hypothetical protein
MSFAVVVFAVVGLGPWFEWVPDVVFVIAAMAMGVINLGQAGVRASTISGTVRDGASAAAVAGAIAGVAAGICYVVFGKGLANLAVLPIVGALAGAAVGSVAAFARR